LTLSAATVIQFERGAEIPDLKAETMNITIETIAALAPNTEAFEAAVEALSDACEAGDKAAGRVLMFALQRNEDFIIRAAH
jgi:hypothetical protein